MPRYFVVLLFRAFVSDEPLIKMSDDNEKRHVSPLLRIKSGPRVSLTISACFFSIIIFVFDVLSPFYLVICKCLKKKLLV